MPTYPAATMAKLLLLTPRRLQQLVTEGVIPKVERGMIPADQFPEFWEWMGRVDKLRDQLLAR